MSSTLVIPRFVINQIKTKLNINTINGLGCILGNFFSSSSGHPAGDPHPHVLFSCGKLFVALLSLIVRHLNFEQRVFCGKASEAAAKQGDQMTIRKNRPKCGPTVNIT
jgi:hypothetical protein